MVVKYFHISYISKNYTIIKVDVLSLTTVSYSLGIPIVCESEEWKRFAQHLVDMPTLLKLHMIKAS